MAVVINRKNIYPHLLEKQFTLVQKTTQDALLDKGWKEWTVSKEKYENFRKYSLALIRKVFKVNKAKSIEIFEWFELTHGLKIK